MPTRTPIRVKIFYRNYRPLHSMFSTYASCPPEGVEFTIPTQKARSASYNVLYKTYVRLGKLRVVNWAVANIADPLIFGSRVARSASNDSYDVYHYLNMVPAGKVTKPFIIELEHISALFGFGANQKQIMKVRQTLAANQCKAIICSSHATEGTLQELFKGEYEFIEHKIHVIYPAICPNQTLSNYQPRQSRDKVELLFVGNNSYVKGLEEVLIALQSVLAAKGKIKLTVISDDAQELIKKYPEQAEAISLHPPRYSKKEIMEKFFSQSDALLLPTKRDTFGFAIIDALACGTPVIATRQFAIPEMIDDQKDGILLKLSDPTLAGSIYLTREAVNRDIVSNPNQMLIDDLVRVFEGLCNNHYPLEDYGRAALRKVKPGARFSAQKRNQKLLEIYKNLSR